MADNNIYPFAQAAVPPAILDDADYLADGTTTTGYVADSIASSAYMSKAQRQTSAICAGLGQFIVDNQTGSTDVTDDLSPATLSAMIEDAVTQVVPEVGGSMLGINTYGVNTTLTDADIGFLVLPSTTGLTFTLPLSSASDIGSVIQFNGNGSGVTIDKQGADTILLGTTGAVTSAVLLANDSGTLINNGAGWTVIDGEMHQAVSSSFEGSLTTTGHKILPGGFILNWISGASNASGVLSASWDKPFTTSVLIGWANESDAGGWSNTSCVVWGFDLSESDLTTGVAHCRDIVGATGPVRAVASGTIFAIGH